MGILREILSLVPRLLLVSIHTVPCLFSLSLSFFTAPSAPPNDVSISAVTSSSITVQWEMVPCIHRNGDITGYSVQYTGGGSTQTMNVSGGSVLEAILTGLSPSTEYTIKVAAVSGATTGVDSESITADTPQSK